MLTFLVKTKLVFWIPINNKNPFFLYGKAKRRYITVVSYFRLPCKHHNISKAFYPFLNKQ